MKILLDIWLDKYHTEPHQSWYAIVIFLRTLSDGLPVNTDAMANILTSM